VQVLKTYAHASTVVYVDEAIVRSAAAWLVGGQQAAGTFRESGRVILRGELQTNRTYELLVSGFYF
jgi:hypothetical protein